MPDLDKVIRGLECCTKAEKDCKNCPIGFGFGCGLQLKRQARVLLIAQRTRHQLEVHNIGNVDIPDCVTREQFHAVMNNVVEALEHTERGESWPYDEDGPLWKEVEHE